MTGFWAGVLYVVKRIIRPLVLPDFFVIMEGRHRRLEWVMEGFRKTQIELLGFNGTEFIVGEKGDDWGLYYIIPKLARLFNVDAILMAQVFLSSLLIVSFGIGLFYLFSLYQNRNARIVSAVGLLFILYQSFSYWDVYVALCFPAMAIVPWCLYTVSQKEFKPTQWVAFFVVGLIASVATCVRGFAGVPVVIFVSVVMLVSKPWHGRKILLLGLLAIGYLIPVVVFNQTVKQRNAFLMENQPALATVQQKQHVFWHPVYIGLGYIGNPYGILFRDHIAIDKVQSIAPGTVNYTDEYERILKEETLRIVRTDFSFVLKVVVVKLSVIAFYLLVFSNIGLWAAWKERKPVSWDLAFFLAMGLNSLYGVIVIPDPQYILGFITLAVLFGVVSVAQAFQLENKGFLPWKN